MDQEKKDAQIGIRLPQEVVEALERFAEEKSLEFSHSTGLEHTITRVEAARMLIIEGLQQRGKLEKKPLHQRIADDLYAGFGRDDIVRRQRCAPDGVDLLRARIDKQGGLFPHYPESKKQKKKR